MSATTTSERGVERYYECLHCGERSGSFERECDACGSREFRTGRVGQHPSTGFRPIEGFLAHLNPFVPR